MNQNPVKELSPYRYRLERDICPSGDVVIAYIGINPSIADEYIDDNTVKNLKVFLKQQGLLVLIMIKHLNSFSMKQIYLFLSGGAALNYELHSDQD